MYELLINMAVEASVRPSSFVLAHRPAEQGTRLYRVVRDNFRGVFRKVVAEGIIGQM